MACALNRGFVSRAIYVTHLSLYYVWVGLLIARAALLVGLICLIVFVYLVTGASSPAHGKARSSALEIILHDTVRDDIAPMRSSCALGRTPANLATMRASGLNPPNAGAWCVTVLTRAGRDGTLGYVRDPRTDQVTPAIAFDNGFVGGYLKREVPPADAPGMAALLPIADRCLAHREANINMCNAVGQMLGTRAAQGETVILD